MSAGQVDKLRIEVACALADRQVLLALDVPAGCTPREAVALSGMAGHFPEIDMTLAPLGIFSRPLNGVELPLPENYRLADGDRVEIYRPLLRDPKQVRLERAQKTQKAKKKKRGQDAG